MTTNIIASRALASRRELLGTLAATPVVLSAPAARASVRGDAPALLRRTREGRSLSRFRYHNAEGFFFGVEQDAALRLYETGIVLHCSPSAPMAQI